jgi:hypothetical protein
LTTTGDGHPQELITLVDPAGGLEVNDRVDIEFFEPLCFDAEGRRINA